MNITMITRAKGPDCNLDPECTYKIPEQVSIELAKELVAAKCATCDQDLFPVQPKPVKETAEAKQKKEAATK